MKLNLSLSVCILMCLPAICLSSCRQKPLNSQKASTAKVKTVALQKQPINEDKAVDLIMKLDEVKRKNAEVEKLSQGKRRLSTYVETSPTAADPNYWVKVAENNGGSYVTYYTFAVHNKTGTIHYYDIERDTLISLEEWRKNLSEDED